MDNPEEVRIVELIGVQRARLSPEGRELWAHAERMIETSLPTDDLVDHDQAMREVLRQTLDLPVSDRVIWKVLGRLFFGLRASSLAEDRWGREVGDKFRRGTVVKAAHERAEAEGRPVPPVDEMTLDEALTLLAEPYSPNVAE